MTKQAVSTQRARARTPNNKTITNFRISDALWKVLQPLLPVHVKLESLVVARPEPTGEKPQGVCLDKGYDYQEVRDLLHEFGFTAHIRARGEEAKALAAEAGKRARRWVVERLLRHW